MAKVAEAIAIGIGPQVDRDTVNVSVRDATDLITGPATGTDATGILLQLPDDLSKTMERIESDGGTLPGSLTRRSGTFIRVEPTVSFPINWKGNGIATGTPDAGDFDAAEYLLQILQGARLIQSASEATGTEHTLGAVADATTFKTLKIWRGASGGTESWTLVGCTFNLSWGITPEEVTPCTVSVIADSVIYNGSDTFPPATPTLAYGEQLNASPICELSSSSIDGTERGFQSATLSVSYVEDVTPDSNAGGGRFKSQGTRTVQFEADFFRDDAENDFDFLTTNLDASGAPQVPVSFRIGAEAGAGEIALATVFDLTTWRITNQDKATGNQVVRTMSGYVITSGTTGFGSSINEELMLTFK